jgi:hypothetical protein
MAAVLDTNGGVVALESAAALWGTRSFRLEPLHVLTTKRPHRGTVHLGIVHSSTSISDDTRTWSTESR